MPELDFSQAIFSVEAVLSGKVAELDLDPPETLDIEEWPPDYAAVTAWRQQQLDSYSQNPQALRDAIAYYSILEAENVADFINHWCWTYDPRNAGKGIPVWMPFVMFKRQHELVEFIVECVKNDAPGMVEKSRDMGATWIGVAVTVVFWLFHPGFVVGWGSNKQEQVDVIGNPNSIFEKIRLLITRLPQVFTPEVIQGIHLKQHTCQNPVNGSVVSGEIGRNIGRGGRSRVYFIDEAAHLEHPESVEASLSENTRCRIDISSVSGPGTVFHRTREAGQVWTPGQSPRKDVSNIFEMDRTDHPQKTDEWYAERRAYFDGRGLGHVVAREIDRDYFASQEGVVIQYLWVEAAVDAHLKLGFGDDGGWSAGLDIADEGIDTNALIKFKGVVCKHLSEWGERDPGVTARRALKDCKSTLPLTLQYDCIGLGTNVKSEVNRLREEDPHVLPKSLKVVPWNAGAAVKDKSYKVIEEDEDSPTNKDFFSNFKAQAWWNVGQMFYRTFRAVTEGVEYDPAELIALDSKSLDPQLLSKLKKELCQAAMGQDARLKMRINKAPEGTKSPNLADALIMCRYPAKELTGSTPGLIGPKVFVGGHGL